MALRLVNASNLQARHIDSKLSCWGTFTTTLGDARSFESFEDVGRYKTCYQPFALVIQNAINSEVLLVRDHFGQAPLFYAVINNQLIVGDNIPDMIHAMDHKPPFLNQALDNLYRPFCQYQDETIYKGIYRVEPGHIYNISAHGQITKKPFWQLNPTATVLAYQHESDYVAAFNELLKTAVQNAVGGHARIAAEFSAGLDSTAIYHATTQIGIEPVLYMHDHPQGSAYQSHYNDVYEKAFMKRFHPQHLHQVNGGDFDVMQAIKLDAKRLGEPSGHLFPTFMSPLYERACANQTDILLSGFGGDQGVSYPANPRFLLPTLMRSAQFKASWRMSRELSLNPFKRVCHLLGSLSQTTNWMLKLATCPKKLLRRDPCDTYLQQSPYHQQYFNSHRHMQVSFLQGALSHEIRSRIETCAIVAKQYGFEYRYPLLYPPLLEFVMQLPVSMLRQQGEGRYLLKRYMTDVALIPEYMNYQKREGRAILPATVTTFKNLQAQGVFKAEEAELIATQKIPDTPNLPHWAMGPLVTHMMMKSF